MSIAHEIVIERQRENPFHNPALQEAELFLEFLKNEISQAFEAEAFLGGWYHFPVFEEPKWRADFENFKARRRAALTPQVEQPAQQMLLF